MHRLGPWLFFIFFLSGCIGQTKDAPPTIRYGEEACCQCRMSIDDAHFASALIDDRGLSRKFDDIGCMKTYGMENRISPEKSWVHDYSNNSWLRVSQAYFVVSKFQTTPMGYGVVAFSDLKEAKNFSLEKKGRVVSWEEIGKDLLRQSDNN